MQRTLIVVSPFHYKMMNLYINQQLETLIQGLVTLFKTNKLSSGVIIRTRKQQNKKRKRRRVMMEMEM
jgi:hypothetical protein